MEPTQASNSATTTTTAVVVVVVAGIILQLKELARLCRGRAPRIQGVAEANHDLVVAAPVKKLAGSSREVWGVKNTLVNW